MLKELFELISLEGLLANDPDIDDQDLRSHPLAKACVSQEFIEKTPLHIFWKDINSNYLGCNSLFATGCWILPSE